MIKRYIPVFLILAALFLIWFFRENIFIGLDNFKNPSQSLNELRLENQGLRLEIEELRNKLNLNQKPYLTAQVYSRYPFNDNQSLIIDVGSRAGVQVGWPVLVSEKYLLGKVVKVKALSSEVRTIFSPDWRSAVRIGKSSTEAVLVGGRQPKLEFIPPDAEINLNDEVFSASSDLPLNLFIGKISEIISPPAASLKQAKLKTDYDIRQIRKVLIVTDYEGFD